MKWILFSGPSLLTLWLVPFRGLHLAAVSGVMERLTFSHHCPTHFINSCLQLEMPIIG